MRPALLICSCEHDGLHIMSAWLPHVAAFGEMSVHEGYRTAECLGQASRHLKILGWFNPMSVLRCDATSGLYIIRAKPCMNNICMWSWLISYGRFLVRYSDVGSSCFGLVKMDLHNDLEKQRAQCETHDHTTTHGIYARIEYMRRSIIYTTFTRTTALHRHNSHSRSGLDSRRRHWIIDLLVPAREDLRRFKLRVTTHGTVRALPLLLRESPFLHRRDRVAALLELVLRDALALEDRRLLDCSELDVVVRAE